jgi:plasmid stabilization system protein ParE
MKLPLVFLLEADEELIASSEYLDLQQAGAGQRFLKLVREALDRIENNPYLHGSLEGNIRAASIRKFHYVIIYRVLANCVEIVAVIHGARDSNQWRQRL